MDSVTANSRREMAVTLSNMGDALMAQKDMNGAVAAFQQGLGLFQQLSAEDRQNSSKRRDVMLAHNRVGLALMVKGDYPAAVDAYEHGLAIARELVAKNPQGAEQNYDLAISLDGMGTALLARKDGRAAAASFREEIPIMRAFANHRAQDVSWQSALAAPYEKCGEALMLCHDSSGAFGMFAAAYKIWDGLAKADPGDTGLQLSLHKVLNLLGDAAMAQADLQKAAPAYRIAYDTIKKLQEEELPNLEFAVRVEKQLEWDPPYARSKEKMGDLVMKQGELKPAAGFFLWAFELYKSLVWRQPEQRVWEESAVRVLEKLDKATGDSTYSERMLKELSDRKSEGLSVWNEMKQFRTGDRIRHVKANFLGTVASTNSAVVVVKQDGGGIGQYDHGWFSMHPKTLVKVPS